MRRFILTLGFVAVAGSGRAFAAPGLIFQSQERSITATGSRGFQPYDYSETNSNIGAWSLHPMFPDTIVLSHESTVASSMISDTTSFDLDALVTGGSPPVIPGKARASEEMHLVFTVDSPTPFMLNGIVSQQLSDNSGLAIVGGSVKLTDFPLIETDPGNGSYPFEITGTLEPGQTYHLDVHGVVDVTASPNGPLETTGSYSMHFTLTVVPEPASLLGFAGLTGLLLLRRRSRPTLR